MLPTISFMTRLSEKNSSSKFSITLITLFALFIILFNSCSKEPGQIGFIIQPDESKLNVAFSDTTTIYAFSEAIDSIRSDKLSVSAFGSLRDPVFGGTTAGFYTQFILSVNGHDFGEERQLDSLVLKLGYEGYYGDTNVVLTAHIYEMLKDISKDSVYYSNLQLPLNPTDYSNFSFEPRPTDSVVYYEDTLPAMLRINLTDISTELGNKLLGATVDDMEDSEIFQEYFNGLFVQSQPVNDEGAILYFGLTSPYTSLSLYYSNSEQDSLRYEYLITTTTATVNKYEHEYNTANQDFKSQVINGDTSLGQQNFYAQGYSGVQSLIKIPHIRKWAQEGNVAINEAKLILPGSSENEFFDAPRQMYLLNIEEDGLGSGLIDATEGDNYFDGYYNDDRNLYEFRITRYIQSLISDTTLPNRGLYLFLFGGSVHPERFIFKGNQNGSDSTGGIKLEILYTDL